MGVRCHSFHGERLAILSQEMEARVRTAEAPWRGRAFLSLDGDRGQRVYGLDFIFINF